MSRDVPALESIHKLAGHIQALAHEARLVAHSIKCIAQQANLVLWRGGSSHAGGRGRRFVVGGAVFVAIIVSLLLLS